MSFLSSYQHIVHCIGNLPVHEVKELAVSESLGLVLAEDLVTTYTHPALDTSAMDGIAVCGDYSHYSFVGDAYAGHCFEQKLEQGQAVRVGTGSVIPQGATRVIPKENIETEASLTLGDTIFAAIEQPNRTHIRKKGEHFSQGETFLQQGTVLTPKDIFVCSNMGRARLAVHRPMRIVLLSSGDELQEPGKKLGPGQSYAGNGVGVRSFIESFCHLDFVEVLRVPDSREKLDSLLRAHLQPYDLLVTIGGASVGDKDFIASALGNMGFQFLFQGAKIRPGKPVALARDERSSITALMLPGNPVSAAVMTRVILIPLIKRLLGYTSWQLKTQLYPLKSSFHKKEGWTFCARAKLMDEKIEALAYQESHRFLSLSQSDGLAIFPESGESFQAGEDIAFLPWAI